MEMHQEITLAGDGFDHVTETLGPGRAPADGTSRCVPALLSGEVVADRFQIVAGLGQGGMGQVYEAFDLELEQAVALKLIRPDLVVRAGVVERFKSEVRLARSITHVNVCRVFDFFVHRSWADDGRPSLVFLTMELLRGTTLAERLRTAGAVAPGGAVALLRQIAAGLDAAHTVGIVHGDLKPENIMLTGPADAPRVVVTDFGLAFARTSPPRHDAPTDDLWRRSSPCVGTPAYLAPEQEQGRRASRRSDLYAFGLVAGEILGTRCQSRRDGHPRAAGRLPSSLPGHLDALLRSCLAPDPQQRPADAGDVLRRLASHPRETEPAATAEWRPEIGAALPQRPNWRFEKKLDSGTDDTAWLARHRKTGEVRVIRLGHDAERLDALRREITLYRLLRSELGPRAAVDRVLDWHLDGDPSFLETEHCGGGTLAEWILRHGGSAKIQPDTLLDLARQVAEAVAAIHRAGVVHGRLGPDTILVDDGPHGPRARLTGFGRGHLLDVRKLELAGISVLSPRGGGHPPFHSASGPEADWTIADPARLFVERASGAPTVADDVRALDGLVRWLVGDRFDGDRIKGIALALLVALAVALVVAYVAVVGWPAVGADDAHTKKRRPVSAAVEEAEHHTTARGSVWTSGSWKFGPSGRRLASDVPSMCL